MLTNGLVERCVFSPEVVAVLFLIYIQQSFAEICEITSIEEGSIVRCIVRLHETCRDVRNAARVIGDAKLFQLMEACSERVKRDIVFAASLYVA